MKFLRRLTILFLAAVLAAASFATVFAAADGAGATAAPSAAPSDGGADGDASAPQTGTEDEAELSLLLPASYEQYLELEDPSDFAINEDYIAIADDPQSGNSLIYIYDRNAPSAGYRVYKHSSEDRLSPLQLYSYGNETHLYFVTGGQETYIYHIALNSAGTYTATQTEISCASFLINGGYLYYSTVTVGQNSIMRRQMSGFDFTGAPEKIDLSGINISSMGVTAPCFFAGNNKVYFSLNSDICSVSASSVVAVSDWSLRNPVQSFAVFGNEVYFSGTGNTEPLSVYSNGTEQPVKRNDSDVLAVSSLHIFGDTLYMICGSSVQTYDPVKRAFGDYEIGKYSISDARLGGNAQISAFGGRMTIADEKNKRISIYTSRSDSYALWDLNYTPSSICAGQNDFLVADNAAGELHVYSYDFQKTSTLPLGSDVDVVDIAYSFGRYYLLTDSAGHGAIVAPTQDGYTCTPASFSSSYMHIAADFFGRLYVMNGVGAVYPVDEDNFLSGTIGESLYSFGNGAIDLAVDYTSALYAVTSDTAIADKDGTSTEHPLTEALKALVYSNDTPLPLSLTYDVITGDCYMLGDGFIAKMNGLNGASLQTLPAEGTHAALTGGAADADGLLVEVPAQSVLLDLTEAEIGADAQFLPYKTYERTDAARTGVKVCETSAGTVVAFFRYAPAQDGNSYTPERDHSLALVLGGVTGPAGGLQAETPFSAHNTSDVYLYRFPSMHLGNGDNAAAGVARLPRGTAFTVHGYVRGAAGGEGGWGLDSDYAYVTVNATGQKGYIPVSYLAEGGVSGGATEFVYRTVDRGESITLFAGSESITLAGRERVKMYGVPDDEGNVYVTYTDADGKVWAGNVPENCLYEAPASATAVLVAVLAVAAVILVSVCYLLLRRQPALD